VDCDDVTLLLAAGEAPTLSDSRAAEYHRHIAECDACRELTGDAGDDRFRWVVRIPEDALDDPDLLVLPIVDPVVFTSDRELARGGMGRITRARDRRLGRDVAIKEVLGPELRARFEREVAITAQLQHPAIVPVYEAGTWPGGSAFYTMRLVSGGTLAEAIARTRSLEQRLALLPHVNALTDALAYAHARRIVHRDLKPSNVLVGEFGETVVIDWGLAKELDHEVGGTGGAALARRAPGLTVAGSVMGTPGFMAPEQAAGENVDARADVYALGAILYNVLAGHPPYLDREGITPDAMIALARDRPPTPLARLAPRVPEDLRAIVERAMAREPSGRYPTAKELADELHRFEAGQLLRSRDYRVRDLLARWIRRHRAAVTVGALALVVVAGIGIAAIANVARSRAAELEARRAAELAQRRGEANVTPLLEEHGRDQLLAGDRTGALTFLAEAYRHGDTSVALRHMLAVATRDLDLRDWVIDTGRGPIADATFGDDGRAVTINSGEAPAITVWNRDRAEITHVLPGKPSDAWLAPGGRRALALYPDGHIELHDAVTGAQRWQIADPVMIDATAVFDRNGDRVVLIALPKRDRKFAELRDAATEAVLLRLEPGAETPTTAAFSPDGRRVAVSDYAGAVGVWDIASGQRLLRVPPAPPPQRGDPGSQNVIEFAGNDRLVIANVRAAPELWTLGGGHRPLHGAQAPLHAVAASLAGGLIAGVEISGTLRVWNDQGSLLAEAHDNGGSLKHLAFSPDGTQLAAGGDDQRVYVWDTATLELLQTLTTDRPHLDHVVRVAWSRDGSRLLAVTYDDRGAQVWRAPAGHRIARAESYGFAVTDQLAVIATATEVVTRRLDTGAVVKRIPFAWPPDIDPPEPPILVYPSSDGQRALVNFLCFPTTGHAQYPCNMERRAAIYDLVSGARSWMSETAVAAKDLTTLLTSADLRRVLAITYPTVWDSTLRLIDTTTGHVLRTLSGPGVFAAALSADGELCALSRYTRSGNVPTVVWNAADALVPMDTSDKVEDFQFAPSGHRLLAYGRDLGRVLDADTGRAIADLRGARDTIHQARFSTDGRLIATWSDGRAAALWDADSGAQRMIVNGVEQSAFAISPDGKRFATGAGDGTIRIWDVETKRLVEVLHGDGSAPEAPRWTSGGLTWNTEDRNWNAAELGWNADGTRLIAGSMHIPSVSIWDVHLEQRSPGEISALLPPSLAAQLLDPLLAPGR
jgi:WD40 repeat protein